MNLAEIDLLLSEKLSPKQFCISSEIYGLHYDEGNKKKIIKKVILTVDLNLEVIHYAIVNKVNLIISHHGLFEKSIKNFSPSLIKKLNLLSNYPISIFVLNTPFIAAEGGISDTLMETLYLKLEDIFLIKLKSGREIPIGRICYPESLNLNENPINLVNLLRRIKANLNMDYIQYSGPLNRTLKRICVVGGECTDEKMLISAKKKDCDCFISFKINHHLADIARDIDLVLIGVSHYQTECLSLKKLCNVLSLEYPKCEFTLYELENPQKFFACQ